MPKRRSHAVTGLVAVLLLAGLALWACNGGGTGTGESVRPDTLALQIHKYLGTNKGDPDKELIANIEANNEFFRKLIDDLQCDIHMLKNPTQPKPTPCPPGGGSKSPVAPPSYPP